MKLKQVISGRRYIEGERPDPFWGFSYWDTGTMLAVCYPIPLNWIVAIARNVYWKFMVAPDLKQKELNEAWHKGYNEGWVLARERELQIDAAKTISENQNEK